MEGSSPMSAYLPAARRVGNVEFGSYIAFFTPYIVPYIPRKTEMVEVPFVKCQIETSGKTAPIEVKWEPEVINGKTVLYYCDTHIENLALQFNHTFNPNYKIEKVAKNDAIHFLEQSIRKYYQIQESLTL